MKPEAQIKALLALDEVKRITCPVCHGDWRTQRCSQCDSYGQIDNPETPDYLTSYDAIIPLIQKQDLIIGKHMMQIMHRMVSGSGNHHVKDFYLFLLSPSQLCEALLRATGKWTE